MEPEDIAYPVRTILRRRSNVHFRFADVEKVDLERRVLQLGSQSVFYDYLMLATGSTSNFFGVPGAADYALPLRTLQEGVTLRNRILSSFEQAADEPDSERRRRLLTFIIVGGGPTGVEFAGALSELIRGPLKKDYRTIDFDKVRVILLEAGSGLLPGLPQQLGSYAAERLLKKSVGVRLDSAVSLITPHEVHLQDGSVVAADTVIWTAGVRGTPNGETWGLPIAHNGRVRVLPTLQVPGYPNAYVIGDLAYVEKCGRPLPMVAPVATQQGEAAARNIARQLEGEEPSPFQYRDLGTMAVIGRNAAVAHLFGRWSFTGFPAWVIWLGMHLFKLIGFRNRLLVLTSWAWDYLFYERVVRLILRSERDPHSPAN